jgi:MSHA biogenesis protein MshL
MKPSTLALGLSALALTLPGPAWAKRLRQAPTDTQAATPSTMSMADFARLDLDALPPPGASADLSAMGADDADRRSSGGMSTRMSLPQRSALRAPAEAGLPAVPGVNERRSSEGGGPRFDLVVNSAPATQVFLQIGAGAGVNVLVPPEVKGNISVSLKAVNLYEALDAIRELYGYDFKVSGNRVFIYANSIQTRIYQVNYLAALREGTSSLKVSNPGRASGGSSGSSTTSSGSTSGSTVSSGGTATTTTYDAAKVQMTTNADFWKDLQASLKDLVGAGGPDRSVVVNAAAGVLIVRASPAEHRNVADYLKALRVSVERQVMLEAKIVEVTLTNDAQSGVNWSLFRSYSNGGKQYGIGVAAPGVTLNQTSGGTLSSSNVTITPGSSIAATTGGAGFYGLALQASNFAAMLNFLESQGEVQVLSSPRIATLNNQKAVLKVGTDAYYPVNLGGTSSTSTTSTTSTTATPPSVDTMFSGIVLDVTPRIDANGAILLHVHPIISSITLESVVYSVGGASGSGQLPKVSVSETDSVVRVMDREIVAIGGLMSTQVTKAKSGMSGLSDLPIVGGLFRQKSTAATKRELVVLIKPTIINEDGDGFEHETPKTTAAAE